MQQITETAALATIKSGAAGYWELLLRDSLGAKPIVHADSYCICVNEQWYSVTSAEFSIQFHGRIGDECCHAAAHSITCHSETLQSMIFQDMRRLEQARPVKREVEVLIWIPAYDPPDTSRSVLVYVSELAIVSDLGGPVQKGYYVPSAKKWAIAGSPSKWEVAWWAEWPTFDPKKRGL